MFAALASTIIYSDAIKAPGCAATKFKRGFRFIVVLAILQAG
jgi:hypothetical protein